jgi:NAD(P)-dependent dehydrogenase (short-subunit alcohol dehydrogenase family)
MSEQAIALVTGANKGIGYEIAVGLGGLGWSVGVGSRDEQRSGSFSVHVRSPFAPHAAPTRHGSGGHSVRYRNQSPTR